jgi:hypothetical protein
MSMLARIEASRFPRGRENRLTRPPAVNDKFGRDPVEVAVLVCFGLLSLWVLGWLVGRSLVNDKVWTGIDGLHASDPALYFGFIASAAHSVLISNVFDTRPPDPVYLHPGFLISGLITHLGLSSWQAYLLWKPVAVVAFFLSVRAYVHRLLTGVGGRRAALVLALLFVPTAAFVASLTHAGPRTTLYLFGIEVDMWPGTWLWGYSFTLLAVAAIPGTLLLYERDRRRRRIGATAPALALLCSWLQPWQGATLVGILVLSEIIDLAVRRHATSAGGAGPTVTLIGDAAPDVARRMRLLAVNVAAASAPLIYYAVLQRLDPAWKLSGAANRIGGWPVWAIAASVAPLAIPAALAYLRKPSSWQDIALRVWPVAGLAVYWAIALGGVGTFPLHAFQGLTIPLGILAVSGVRGLVETWNRPRVLVMTAVVAALVVPALVWKMHDAEKSTRGNIVSPLVGPPEVYFLTHGEADALEFLRRDPEPGAVLDDASLGEVTPGRTGRQTWVGIPSYTPSYSQRAATTERLFDVAMPGRTAVAYVRSARVRYVLVDCEHNSDVVRLISPLVSAVRRFGCATLITLRPPKS